MDLKQNLAGINEIHPSGLIIRDFLFICLFLYLFIIYFKENLRVEKNCLQKRQTTV